MTISASIPGRPSPALDHPGLALIRVGSSESSLAPRTRPPPCRLGSPAAPPAAPAAAGSAGPLPEEQLAILSSAEYRLGPGEAGRAGAYRVPVGILWGERDPWEPVASGRAYEVALALSLSLSLYRSLVLALALAIALALAFSISLSLPPSPSPSLPLSLSLSLPLPLPLSRVRDVCVCVCVCACVRACVRAFAIVYLQTHRHAGVGGEGGCVACARTRAHARTRACLLACVRVCAYWRFCKVIDALARVEQVLCVCARASCQCLCVRRRSCVGGAAVR